MRISSNGAVPPFLLFMGLVSSASAEEYVKSYAVTGRAAVRVNADNASVRISTSDAANVQFNVSYEGWGSDAPKIASHQEGQVAELTVRTATRWWPSFDKTRLNIEVHMPKTSDLNVVTSNGAVDVAAVNGSVVIHTSNGTIRLQQITGTVDAGSTNGTIALAALKGNVKAGTTNGTIRADGLDGQCDLSTTNGHVQVAGRFDALDISSGNGSVVAEAEAGSTVSSAWRIRTTNASVNLAIPKSLRANLSAGTTNGRVTLEFPNENTDGGTELHTALNGGGQEVSVHTSNGAIHLRGI